MDRKTWLNYFNASAEAVQNYFLDNASAEAEQVAQTKLAYDNDVWDRVMDIVWDLIFLNITRQEFKDRVKAICGDRKPEEVERVLLQSVVLPLEDLVYWDVESYLQELGVPMSDIQAVPRISLRPLSYGAAVRRIVTQAKLSILGEEMLRRLRELFVSYIKNVRTIEQVKAMLQKTQLDGGIGLSKEQSDFFCDTMVQFLLTTQVMSEQEYADWLTKKQNEMEETQHTSRITHQEAPGDEAEVKAVMASAPAGQKMMIEQVVDETMQQINLPNLEEYLKRRLRNVISTRLRDVRSQIQTKSILEREDKVGGLGFTPEETARVAQLIEQTYTGHRVQIEDEEKQNIASTVQAQQEKIDERKKRESADHAKWYEEKIKATRPEELLRKQYELAQTSNQNPLAPLSGGSIQPTKPSLDGIQPPTKLVGLGEELAGMTLAEFRRLSKDPKQAMETIKRKLETLKNESFDRWTEGLEAWRRSPLQKQYLTLITQSFASGKPVAQLVEEKRLQDPSLPTADELSAIIQLNSELTF